MRNFNARRLLFDTNVLLDALIEGRPESAEAWEVLKRCNGGGDMGLVTSGSLKDAYYVLGHGGREAAAREAVGLLMGLLVIAPIGAEECELSMRSGEPDFEDGLVRACAELNDVDFILTRDERAFRTSRVRALTCREYLELFGVGHSD
ncbi:type II toxin-antitoxin system VapC family toxin [Enorma phocaeensis]|uniref:PIN domain-containing protein n=1 Tax=Enorma phocaeensis TaxID=1871019 RepID=A0A921IV86_9ACTN|nr:PIN domain-containing protein [Enorma phocaeensis]HJG36660.1 PIN domain-containing protein [Enorma phocaeensis]